VLHNTKESVKDESSTSSEQPDVNCTDQVAGETSSTTNAPETNDANSDEKATSGDAPASKSSVILLESDDDNCLDSDSENPGGSADNGVIPESDLELLESDCEKRPESKESAIPVGNEKPTAVRQNQRVLSSGDDENVPDPSCAKDELSAGAFVKRENRSSDDATPMPSRRNKRGLSSSDEDLPRFFRSRLLKKEPLNGFPNFIKQEADSSEDFIKKVKNINSFCVEVPWRPTKLTERHSGLKDNRAGCSRRKTRTLCCSAEPLQGRRS